MKDKEARRKIEGLEAGMGALGLRLEATETLIIRDLAIKFCKKCRHLTVQQKGEPPGYFASFGIHEGSGFDYMCLVCGTKWLCQQETVCKEVRQVEKNTT